MPRHIGRLNELGAKVVHGCDCARYSVPTRSFSLSTNSSTVMESHARLLNLKSPGRRRVIQGALVLALIYISADRGAQEPITALAVRSLTCLSRIRSTLQEHTQMGPPRLVAGGTSIGIRKV